MVEEVLVGVSIVRYWFGYIEVYRKNQRRGARISIVTAASKLPSGLPSNVLNPGLYWRQSIAIGIEDA